MAKKVSGVRQVTRSLYASSLFHEPLLSPARRSSVQERLETQKPSGEIISKGAWVFEALRHLHGRVAWIDNSLKSIPHQRLALHLWDGDRRPPFLSARPRPNAPQIHPAPRPPSVSGEGEM